MFMKSWKKEILTIPNLLSLFRLALIPVYIRIYLNARTPSQYFLSGIILAFSCLTDLIDGRIARHFNMVSTLGKILDPLADKITQLTLTVCLSLRYPALNPVLVLFVVKELLQLTMGAFYLYHGKMLSGALMAGKLCTTVLFTTLTALVIFPRVPEFVVNAIALTDSIFLMIALLGYLLAYWRKHPSLKDLNSQ